MDRPTVVLIEDHLDSLEMYALLLRHAGYDVREASTADAALHVLREVRPDAVVMDVGLPDIDGIELCRRLRHDARFGPTPIIGVTGWGTARWTSRLEEAPFSELLLKPVEPDALVAAVERWAPPEGVAIA